MGKRRDSDTSRPLAGAESEEFLRAMRDLDSVPDKDGAQSTQSNSYSTGSSTSHSSGPSSGPNASRGRRRKQSRRQQATNVEARLDLHGETVEHALGRLDAFVARCYESRHRRVLVITGKGNRSPGGEGVLRRQVGAWLRRHVGPAARTGNSSGAMSRAGSRIESFAPAPNELGGAGAWVLTLRRPRR